MAHQYRAKQAGHVLPIRVRNVKSHRPCESCGVKKVRYQARFNPPGKGRISFRLCDSCIEAIRL